MTDAGRRRGVRLRRAVALVLIVLGAGAAVAGGVLLYVREEIIDTSTFAGRAVSAVRKPALNRVVSREISVQLVEPSLPDLVAARPVIEAALSRVIAADAFAPVIRVAAEHGHRLLFERGGGNAVFDVADAGAVVSSALRTLAPSVAQKLPARTDAVLLTLRRRSFAEETLRFAEAVRVLGIVLPILAIVLLAGGIFCAPARRRAITAAALAGGIGGVVLVIALELLRRYVVTHVYGTGELKNRDVRAAAGDLWSAFLGDLVSTAALGAVVAFLVAAASAGVLRPYSPAAGLRRAGELARVPLGDRARAVRAAIVLAVGIAAIVEPETALRVLVIVLAAVLVYAAVGELLSVLPPAPRRVTARQPAQRRRSLVAAAAGAALAALGITLGVILTGGARPVRAATLSTCNGYPQLCDRRLDEVVFAGTHNSMSAADSPGWLIANQDRDVEQQLTDGIRLFKISTHYAVQDSAGGVHTNIAAEGTNVNRVASKLDPRARLALQRLSLALSPGSVSGRKRDIWLCHTLCELGATRFVDFLGEIRRFLDRHPNQVLILFDEDYVSEPDLQRAFQRAKLLDRLAVLRRDQPPPTLGDLIRSRHNILVFAQKPISGRFAWNTSAFSFWIQDTPLGAQKPSQFTCKFSRGLPSGRLLMLNNWADLFPPRASPNEPLVKRSFILARARQCVQQRGVVPNLILTDYYNRGDVIGAVAALNGVSGPPAS